MSFLKAIKPNQVKSLRVSLQGGRRALGGGRRLVKFRIAVESWQADGVDEVD